MNHDDDDDDDTLLKKVALFLRFPPSSLSSFLDLKEERLSEALKACGVSTEGGKKKKKRNYFSRLQR
jgi:hypothetical protein